MASEKSVSGKQKLGGVTAFLMLGLAALFDGAQFAVTFLNVLPGIGFAISAVISFFITIVSTAVFGIWFLLTDIYSAGRIAAKLLTWLGTSIIELVPLINALPATTLMVVLIIILTRAEDMLTAKSGGRVTFSGIKA